MFVCAAQDLHLALQWVQNNIAAFGGDPSRVTLHAQSGGGVLALATMVSPAAMTGPTRDSRWFQRVVLTSPTAYTYNSLSGEQGPASCLQQHCLHQAPADHWQMVHLS